MKINSVKIISLLFFVLSAFYLYTAHQIQVFAFDENAPFNAKTFPIYLGYAGMFFSGLKIILPDQKPIEVDPKYYRPTEVDNLLGNAKKASQELGWKPELSLEDTIKEMMDHDLQKAKEAKLILNNKL